MKTRQMKTVLVCVLTAGLLSGSMAAQAAFIDRGGGLIFDTTLNVTWLQDMNYAQTSGAYIADRDHQYDAARSWADTLEYGGYSDWRLPSGNLLNDYAQQPGESSPEFSNRMQALHDLRSFDGSTGYSYNNIRSELGHLFAELGNLALYDAQGNVQSGSGLTQSGPFVNLQNGRYYQDQRFVSYFGEFYAWGFDFSNGAQNQLSAYLLPRGSFVTAVRDGDVSVVPEPATVGLMGLGLLLVAGMGRRKFAGKFIAGGTDS